MKIKVSDYIANYVSAAGIRHVFMVTGGGAMHLNNSLAKHPALTPIFNHHEQASAMAAESYARLSGRLAVVNVTSGPGGINAMNGVFGAFTDSIPMLVISGQVRFDTTVQSSGMSLRQLGDQEFPGVIACAKTMTKYAVTVTEAETIRLHLDKALSLATQGRPGPVWLDIPMNIQGALVEEEDVDRYALAHREAPVAKPEIPQEVFQKILGLLKTAKRPVVYAGTGIRLAGAVESFSKMLETLNLPAVLGFTAQDLLPTDHPLNIGRPGSNGDRAGNFAVQNSDLLIVIGARLNIRQIGYNWTTFARAATKVMVDIDREELFKPTLKIEIPVHGDAKDFIAGLMESAAKPLAAKTAWLEQCRKWKTDFPVVLPEYWDRKDLINPYCFIDVLFKHLQPEAAVVCGNATACVSAYQAGHLKAGQRLYSNSGSASMGYDLPAAIGAAVAEPHRPTICLAGDGSIQMNLQELQTIQTNQLPVKIFVLNNQGYHSIRQTQSNFFGDPLIGCQARQGIDFPDMEKLAGAYGYPFLRARNHQELDSVIRRALSHPGAVICEIMLTPDQPFAPKPSSVRLPDGRMVSRPMEDQAPFLDRQVLKDNMYIPLLEE